MRLALIGPSAPLRGGIAHYHDRLAASLAARGHAVARISFRRLYPALFFPGRSQYVPEAPGLVPPADRRRVPAAEAEACGLVRGHPHDAAVARAGGGSENGLPPEALDALAPPDVLLDSLAPPSWRRVALAAARADAVVCEWWHPYFAPALAVIALMLRRRGVPTVFVCHNLDPHDPVPGGALLSRLALARATAFVAQGSADAERLRACYPGRPVALVLPPAEAPPPCGHGNRGVCARALGLPWAKRRVLLFGYVRAYKGLPTLIEALAEGPPDVQL
ncbi:MAG: glycosyltransferase, partial [Candidatus Binatia bacterium]